MSKVKNIKGKFSILLITVLLNGCMNNHLHWTDTVGKKYQPTVEAGRSGVVIYRVDGEGMSNTVNVYINNEYLSSLSSGSYTQSAVCPGEQVFYASQSGMDASYYGKQHLGHSFMIAEGQTLYLKVINQQGRASLEPISSDQAKLELINLARQNHTLSRVGQNQTCVNQ